MLVARRIFFIVFPRCLKVRPNSGESELGMHLFSTQHRPNAINQAVIRANEKTMVQQCHSAGIGPIPPAPAAAGHRHNRPQTAVFHLIAKDFPLRRLVEISRALAREQFVACPIAADSTHQKALFALVGSV
jgi:hypothetical protein